MTTLQPYWQKFEGYNGDYTDTNNILAILSAC